MNYKVNFLCTGNPKNYTVEGVDTPKQALLVVIIRNWKYKGTELRLLEVKRRIGEHEVDRLPSDVIIAVVENKGTKEVAYYEIDKYAYYNTHDISIKTYKVSVWRNQMLGSYFGDYKNQEQYNIKLNAHSEKDAIMLYFYYNNITNMKIRGILPKKNIANVECYALIETYQGFTKIKEEKYELLFREVYRDIRFG